MPFATNSLGLDQDLVERTIEFMSTRTDLGRALGEFVTALGTSREQFSRVFKRATGSPPHHYFLLIRVERARALLLEADLPKLAHIALALGFADQAHFTRQFKRVVGLTPGEFVKMSHSLSASTGTNAA